MQGETTYRLFVACGGCTKRPYEWDVLLACAVCSPVCGHSSVGPYGLIAI